jgi:hypothetical protein
MPAVLPGAEGLFGKIQIPVEGLVGADKIREIGFLTEFYFAKFT